MTNFEIKKLLVQIKVFYPRFDSVERTSEGYWMHPQTIDAWFRQLGWMDYDRAILILDQHMSSEDGGKMPNVALWMRNGKKQQSSAWHNAYLDLRHGVIVWQPEDGDVYERKIVRADHGCYEDEDGYLWAFPGG